MIIGLLNINSISNKFYAVIESILSKTDIFLLSEAKVDGSKRS